jgi:ABC-type transport system substrate-binding protein
MHPHSLRIASAALLAVVLGMLPVLTPLASDTPKTLRTLIVSGETTFDPAVASDVNTLSILENLFDPLLRYDYLARPVRLQPNTALEMPRVSDDRTVYTFRLRPGIVFTPSPAFGQTRRELTAQDYVYSIKRLYDPALKSPWLFLFEGVIAGDHVLSQQEKRRNFDYDFAVSGLQALDRHTLQIRLVAPDPNFLFKLAMPATAALAREVIDAHRGDAGNHPVGTGPFLIEQWQRSNRIVLRANPDFRETIFPGDGTPAEDPRSRAIATQLAGKKLPLLDRIDIRVMEEPQARVLAFLRRDIDYLEQVPPALTGLVLADGKLKPELAAQQIGLSLFSPLQTYYLWMNMEDPILGGYSNDRIALRRAIAMSYDRAEDIRLLERGLALPAQSPLPPAVPGADASYRSPVQYDIALARALLDRFGYRVRGNDAFRSMPDGSPLVLTMHTLASGAGRVRDELWRRNLHAIGIDVRFISDKYGEIIKASRLGQVQMFETNWLADFPDADNFFQLLYGPNSGRANYARFNLPRFNRLYEQARQMPDSPARTKLYRDMTQLLHAYTPWILRMHPLSADLHHPWVKHYLRHPVELTAWRYLDIDPSQRQAADSNAR